MADVWLRTNTRALWLPMIGFALVAAAGAATGCGWLTPNVWVRTIGFAAFGLSAFMLIGLAWHSRLPRLAYQAGELQVRLRGGPPYRVPIGIVECFLLGRGPSFLPGRKHAETETATAVIRLSERADDWSHREVHPALGSWCDNHIIFRGTWCEPLGVDLIMRLNERLAAAQREWNATGGLLSQSDGQTEAAQ